MNGEQKSRRVIYHDIRFFLIFIPLVNALNYYLTYTDIKFNTHTAVTFLADTMQGFVAWWVMRIIILYLDKKLPFQPNPLKRIAVQTSVTSVAALGLIIITTEILNAFFRDTPVPAIFYRFDIFIFLIWFVAINAIYVGLHYYGLWRNSERVWAEEKRWLEDKIKTEVDSLKTEVDVLRTGDNVVRTEGNVSKRELAVSKPTLNLEASEINVSPLEPDLQLSELNVSGSESNLLKSESNLPGKRFLQNGFLVKQGKQHVLVQINELAAVFVEGEYAMLLTLALRKHLYDLSLEKIEKRLPGEQFFRVNRQLILNRHYITGFERHQNGKITVSVINPGLFPSPIEISRTKAAAFKSWFTG
jgi:LytTr DNA-binding domain-containing protein